MSVGLTPHGGRRRDRRPSHLTLMRGKVKCPKEVADLMDGGDEEPCHTLLCGVCGPDLAATMASAVGLVLRRAEAARGKPARSAEINQPAETDFTDGSLSDIYGFFKPRVEQVIADLQNHYDDVEGWWVLELSAANAPHVHLLQTGRSTILNKRLKRVAWAADLGLAKVEPVIEPMALAPYLLKLPLASLKVGDPAIGARFMAFATELNGGGIHHYTGDFFKSLVGHPAGEEEITEVVWWLERKPLAHKLPGRVMKGLPSGCKAALWRPDEPPSKEFL